MGAPCFPQPNLWLVRRTSISRTILKKFVALSIQQIRIGIKPFIPVRAESMAAFVGAPSAPSIASVPSYAVLRRLVPSCAVLPSAILRDGADGKRSETIVFPSVPPISAKKKRPKLLFSFSAKYLHQRQHQQQEEAATTTTAGGYNSSRRRKQQQQHKEQQEEATGGSRRQQEEAAAGSRKSTASQYDFYELIRLNASANIEYNLINIITYKNKIKIK